MNNNIPTIEHLFTTINAFQQSAVLKGAIELDIFTIIAGGRETARAIAEQAGASERGVRILCDYLTVIGFLTKQGDSYGLSPDSAFFLDRNSPAYAGGTLEFLHAPMMLEAFGDIAATVRKGGTIVGEEGSVSPENPVWERFARAMAPMAAVSAGAMAGIVEVPTDRSFRILDIAAGHGLFGITFASRHPNVEVYALDWPGVLKVASENAARFGVADRHHTIPGSAFDVDLGTGYDLALITNFLHHFDAATCTSLMGKIHRSLAPQGRAVTLEFIPDEDRISPPAPAAFAMVMLASTAAGDAYTFSEYEKIMSDAGFSGNELIRLPQSPQSLIISRK